MAAQMTRMRWPMENLASGFGEYEMGMDIETQATISSEQTVKPSGKFAGKRKRHHSSSCFPSSDNPDPDYDRDDPDHPLIIPEPNTPLSLPPPTTTTTTTTPVSTTSSTRNKRQRSSRSPPTTNRHHPHLPLKSPYLGPVGWTVPRKLSGSLRSRIPRPFLIYQDPEIPGAHPHSHLCSRSSPERHRAQGYQVGGGGGGAALRFRSSAGVNAVGYDDGEDGDGDDYMHSVQMASDDDKENMMVMSDEILAMAMDSNSSSSSSSRRGSRWATPRRAMSRVDGDDGVGGPQGHAYAEDIERAIVDMEDGYDDGDGDDNHLTLSGRNAMEDDRASTTEQPILEPEVITAEQLPSPRLDANDGLFLPTTLLPPPPPTSETQPPSTVHQATTTAPEIMTPPSTPNPATPEATTTTERELTEPAPRTRTAPFPHRRSHSLQAPHPRSQQSGPVPAPAPVTETEHELDQPSSLSLFSVPPSIIATPVNIVTDEESPTTEAPAPWRQRLGVRARHLSDQPFPLVRRVKGC